MAFICMDLLKVIGANMAHLRDALGLSQQQLAEYLNVNRVEISYFETGQRLISNSKLLKLSDLAGIDPADLRKESFAKKPVEVQFAFRSDGIDVQDLMVIADFQRIARTYLRFKRMNTQEEL